MSNLFKLSTLFLGAALIIGCGQKSVSTPAAETATLKPVVQEQKVAEHNPVKGNKLVKKAKSAIGTPYVLGGSAPGGFDCSGLVQWAYNSVGVSLPRTAREQASVGQKVRDVKDMRAGDIVAFRHPKRGYHTGIYVGDGKFVHSPRKRTSVRINSLSDPYFRTTLLGARRVNLSGSENLIAHADGSLEKYVAEKSRMRLSARNLEKIRAASSKKNATKTQKAVAAKKGSKSTVGHTQQAKKKSAIAQQARKIKSVKSVTGKSRTNTKNSDAHAKLASASKKTTKTLAKATKTGTMQKASDSSSKSTKTVSMLTHKTSRASTHKAHKR